MPIVEFDAGFYNTKKRIEKTKHFLESHIQDLAEYLSTKFRCSATISTSKYKLYGKCTLHLSKSEKNTSVTFTVNEFLTDADIDIHTTSLAIGKAIEKFFADMPKSESDIKIRVAVC